MAETGDSARIPLKNAPGLTSGAVRAMVPASGETGVFPWILDENTKNSRAEVRRATGRRLPTGDRALARSSGGLALAGRQKRWDQGMTDSPSDPKPTLDELYMQLSKELWAIFYSQCSDSERAYDAVQESFLRMHSYTGEPIRDARAWLLRVGQNWLRDVARRKSSSTRLTPSLDEMVPQPDTVNNLLMGEESRDTVRAALTTMIEDDRKVLVMKYSLGWSSAQMAKVMDCTAAAIDMRLSRARRRLAELLEEQGFGND